MSYSQLQRRKVDLLRERYRKRRRKQLAAITGIVLACIALLALVVLLVMGVRSCSRRDTALSHEEFTRLGTGGELPRKVVVYGVETAPWLVAAGEQSLVIAGDTTRQQPSYPSYPVNYLALYDYGQSSSAWSEKLSGSLTDMQIAGECVVTANQSLADPQTFELAGYKLSKGSRAWAQSIPQAQYGQLATTGKVACVSYLLPDGYRLAAYNSLTGAKAWGMKVNMPDGAYVSSSAQLSIRADAGYVAYFTGNSFGLLEAGTGKQVREPLNFDGIISDMAMDAEAKAVFLTIDIGNGNHLVKYLPFRSGIPLDRFAFKTDSAETEYASLVCNGARALLAWRPTDNRRGYRLAGLEASRQQPVFTGEIDHGSVTDIVSVAGSPTSFLVAVNQFSPASGRLGWGKLYNASFDTGIVKECGSFSNQVDWLATIDSGSLALLHGGRVLAYIAELGQLVQLEMMEHSGVQPVASASGGHLAVLSFPEEYSMDAPGSRMQIMVLD